MKCLKRALASFILCFAVAAGLPAPSWGQQDSAYKLEVVSEPPAGLPEEIRTVLRPDGARLLGENSQNMGEVWVRAAIPLNQFPPGSGYAALPRSILVGVLHLPQGGADFRGQPVRPGSYTLRYERLPQDGNHMGAAPQEHFLLLCPGDQDRSPDAVFSFNDLVGLSRKVSGTNHPAILMLLPVAAGEIPGIQTSEMGHVAVRMRTMGQPQVSSGVVDFPIAVVLVGKAEL